MASALRAQVAALTLAIDKQEGILIEMQKKLRSLQQQLDSIVYPVSNLPPEVVSEIFIQCLPESDLASVHPREPPLLLAQISRHWREITFATPQLWSKFSIGRTGPQARDLLETWFNRGCSCALSFGFSALPRDKDKMGGFLDVFKRQTNRMRYLQLGLDPVTMENPEKLNIPLEFLRLEELCIRLSDNLLQDFVVQMVHSAPLLHKVVLNAVIPHTSIALPWQQLTDYTGYVYTPAEFLDALSVMPNLTHCDVSIRSNLRGQTLPSPLLHAKIEDFSTTDVGGWEPDGSHMLQCLTLPALHTLRLGDADRVKGAVLDAFLQRSSPPLAKLIIRPVPGHTPFTSHFRTLGLTDLTIRHPSRVMSQVGLHMFGPRATSLPRLQNLSIHCGGGKKAEVNLEEVVSQAATAVPLLRARTSAGLPSFLRLTSDIEAYKTFYFPKHKLHPFQELIAAGMDVHIGSEKESII